MKRLIVAIALLMLTSVAYAESETIVIGDDGTLYIKGTFYKDLDTNEIFKVTHESEDEARLGYFDDAILDGSSGPKYYIYGGEITNLLQDMPEFSVNDMSE